MPNRADTYRKIKAQCEVHGAQLIVVSKMRADADVMALYALGQRAFAENKVQELTARYDRLPKDIEWHLVGHLQSNKVNDILPKVRCIQSLDSLRLWKKIQDECEDLDMTMNCLLQMKVAQEETKFGWVYSELTRLLKTGTHHPFDRVTITDIMGMATLTSSTALIEKEMRQLKQIFDELKSTFFADVPEFKTISMGMSGDYEIALAAGSNMVRIGSLLFE